METIIVGGGIAGLVAANVLADRGAKVTLLEAAPDAGGRARSEPHAGGILNLGPHALYKAGAARSVLVAAGPGHQTDRGQSTVVHVGQYLDPIAELTPAVARAHAEALIDRLLPDWRDRTKHVRFLPRSVVTHWFCAADTSGEVGRPGVRLDDDLFIAGDWVGAHGMLVDAAISSAVEAVETLFAQRDDARAYASV